MPHVNEWTPEEDERLEQLIMEYGPKKWSLIASKLDTKGSKQCRRRWKNYLNLDVKKGSWTAEEDSMLIAGHRLHGNKWTEIAKLVGGRTDNAVKNRWTALCKKSEKLGFSEPQPPRPTRPVKPAIQRLPRQQQDQEQQQQQQQHHQRQQQQQPADEDKRDQQQQGRWHAPHVAPVHVPAAGCAARATASGLGLHKPILKQEALYRPTPIQYMQAMLQSVQAPPDLTQLASQLPMGQHPQQARAPVMQPMAGLHRAAYIMHTAINHTHMGSQPLLHKLPPRAVQQPMQLTTQQSMQHVLPAHHTHALRASAAVQAAAAQHRAHEGSLSTGTSTVAPGSSSGSSVRQGPAQRGALAPGDAPAQQNAGAARKPALMVAIPNATTPAEARACHTAAVALGMQVHKEGLARPPQYAADAQPAFASPRAHIGADLMDMFRMMAGGGLTPMRNTCMRRAEEQHKDAPHAHQAGLQLELQHALRVQGPQQQACGKQDCQRQRQPAPPKVEGQTQHQQPSSTNQPHTALPTQQRNTVSLNVQCGLPEAQQQLEALLSPGLQHCDWALLLELLNGTDPTPTPHHNGTDTLPAPPALPSHYTSHSSMRQAPSITIPNTHVAGGSSAGAVQAPLGVWLTKPACPDSPAGDAKDARGDIASTAPSSHAPCSLWEHVTARPTAAAAEAAEAANMPIGADESMPGTVTMVGPSLTSSSMLEDLDSTNSRQSVLQELAQGSMPQLLPVRGLGLC